MPGRLISPIVVVAVLCSVVLVLWAAPVSAQTCARPAINSIAPVHASVGDTVYIVGARFGLVPGVATFPPGIPAEVAYWSKTMIYASVPPGAETGAVTVTNSCGETSLGKYFALAGSDRSVLNVYVSRAGSNSTGNGSKKRPWRTIKYAVETTFLDSITGSEFAIHIAAGTYAENVVGMSCHQSLLGGYSADFSERDVVDRTNPRFATIINGRAQDSAVEMGVCFQGTPEISGFTIRNGATGIACNNLYPSIHDNTITSNLSTGILSCNGPIIDNIITRNKGGGIESCEGAISGNKITYNTRPQTGSFGGGIHGCGGHIFRNIISHNEATHAGGGLYDCGGRIEENTITGNSAYEGGGLHSCNGIITNNTITQNVAEWLGGGLCKTLGDVSHNKVSYNSAGFQGGGMFHCDGNVFNNTIRGNSAEDGGGLARCNGPVSDNVITKNKAGNRGGGMYLVAGPMNDNTITSNRAEGDGGGVCDPLNRIEGGVITKNHAVGLGGGVSYSITSGVVIAAPVRDNLSEERPTIFDCKAGLYFLLQDVDNILTRPIPWYKCILD
ncbi:MAG: hypothetical protein WAW37_09350 [Syntrophobacteraceae bacterium]